MAPPRRTKTRTNKKKTANKKPKKTAQQSPAQSEQGGVRLYEESSNANAQPSSPVVSNRATVQSSPRLSPDVDQGPAQPPPRRSSPKKSKKSKKPVELLKRPAAKKPASVPQPPTNPSGFNPTKILKREANQANLDQAVQRESFPVTHYNSIRAAQSRYLKNTANSTAALTQQPLDTQNSQPPAQNQQPPVSHIFNPPVQNRFGQTAQAPRPVTREFYHQGAAQIPLTTVTRPHHAAHPQQQLTRYNYPAAPPQQHQFNHYDQAAQTQPIPVTRDFYNAAPGQQHLAHYNYPAAPPQQHFNHPNFNNAAQPQLLPVTRDFYNHATPSQERPPAYHEYPTASYPQTHSYSEAAQVQRYDSAHSHYQAPSSQHPHAQFVVDSELHHPSPDQDDLDSYSVISSQHRGDTPPHHRQPLLAAFPPQFLRQFSRQPNTVSSLPPPHANQTATAQVYHKQFGGYFSQQDINLIQYKLDIMSQQDPEIQQAMRAQQAQRLQQALRAQQAQPLSPTAAPFNPPTPTPPVQGPPSRSSSADTMNKYAETIKRYAETVDKYPWVPRKISRERDAQQADRSDSAFHFSDVPMKSQHAHSHSLPAADPALASQPGAPGTAIPMRKTVLLAPDMDITDETWEMFTLALSGRLDMLNKEAKEYESRVRASKAAAAASEQTGHARKGSWLKEDGKVHRVEDRTHGGLPIGVVKSPAHTLSSLSATARASIDKVATATGKRGPFEFSDEELFGAFGYKPPSQEQVQRLFDCYAKVLAEHQKRDEELAAPPPMQGPGLGFGVEVPPPRDEHFLADTYLARGGPKLQREHVSLAIRAAGPFGKGLTAEDEQALAPAASSSSSSSSSSPAPASAAPPTKKPLGKAPAPALVPASLLPSGAAAGPAKEKKFVPAAVLANPFPSPWATNQAAVPDAWKAAYDRSVWNGKQLPKELRRNQPAPASDDDDKGEGPFKSYIPGLGPDH